MTDESGKEFKTRASDFPEEQQEEAIDLARKRRRFQNFRVFFWSMLAAGLVAAVVSRVSEIQGYNSSSQDVRSLCRDVGTIANIGSTGSSRIVEETREGAEGKSLTEKERRTIDRQTDQYEKFLKIEMQESCESRFKDRKVLPSWIKQD